MCCFSQPVKSVSNTKIFARLGENNRQYLVYSMNVNASRELAMVLPIPVVSGSGEKAVQFINLENYPDFFHEMDWSFPSARPETKGVVRSDSLPVLEVVTVGSFEASFVPTIRDFTRLDERFRLPPNTFRELRTYKDYGFAVFKLKPGNQAVHPMAFSFPTAMPTRLFFPTVHIHDGKIHSRAKFEHVLYCQQSDALRLSLKSWEESRSSLANFMDRKKAKEIIDPNEHCYKRELRGSLRNRDVLIEALT